MINFLYDILLKLKDAGMLEVQDTFDWKGTTYMSICPANEDEDDDTRWQRITYWAVTRDNPQGFGIIDRKEYGKVFMEYLMDCMKHTPADAFLKGVQKSISPRCYPCRYRNLEKEHKDE